MMVNVQTIKKVLVSGGSGFIGSHLVHALLKNGYFVRVLDTHYGFLEPVKDISNIEFVGIGHNGLDEGMLDIEIVQKAEHDIDVVYHLAFNLNGHTWTHNLPLANLFDTNIRGTLNLLEACRDHNVKHFLFSSSCAVYGQSIHRMVDEENICKPETWQGDTGPSYGIVKYTTERLCLLYQLEYDLPITIFRIDFIFDDTHGLPSNDIETNLFSDSPINVVEGDGFSGIHIEDTIQAFLLATLNEKAYGQIFNLSDPTTYLTYRELYVLLIPLVRPQAVIHVSTNPLAVGRVIESTKKITEILGWKPKRTKNDLIQAIIREITIRT